MGPKFFQTGMGKKFFEGDIPRLVRTLERIAKSLEQEQVPKDPRPPDAPKVTWVCCNCGGDSVEVMTWVLANTGDVTGDVEPTSPDSTYCNSCDGHHGVIPRAEYTAKHFNTKVQRDAAKMMESGPLTIGQLTLKSSYPDADDLTIAVGGQEIVISKDENGDVHVAVDKLFTVQLGESFSENSEP